MRNSNRTSARMMAVLFSLLFVFAVACGDDEGGGNNTDDTNNTLRDAGGGDEDGGGGGGGDEDGGGGGDDEDGGGGGDDEDGGGGGDDEDGGGSDQCQPLDPSPADQADCSALCQTGCADGEACVYGNDESGATFMACQPAGTAGQGETCDQSTPCDVGFGCFLAAEGDTEGTCQQFCRTDSTDEPQCEGEATCAMIAEGIGVCRVPEESCTQWPNDSCGDGQNCYQVQGGGTECFDYDDTAEAGDDCAAPNECNDAQLCAGSEDGSGNQCYDRCDPNASEPECDDGQACAPLQSDSDQGVCVDQQ
ncbi:MAG: hypothetical protein ACLFVJ_05060 [Persicimonas sp.]